jgi:hypothetical protein
LLDLNSGLCFECFFDQVISETKEDIKKDAEATRTAWKEDKPRFERLIQEAKREDPVLGKKLEKAFQEIENLLYPERKKGNGSDSGGSGWIWVLVIVIVAGVGIIVAWVLYRNKRGTKK